MNIPEVIRKNLKLVIVLFVFLFITAAIAVPHFMELTASPEFCGGCHVMVPQYEDWFYSGAHKSIKCVECHLPNDNFLNHYVWKGIDGMKDFLLFHSGLYSDDIHSTSHAKKVIRSNCLRCHEGMVSAINTDTMNCWQCHRGLYHNITD